jgi:hypothetical protein
MAVLLIRINSPISGTAPAYSGYSKHALSGKQPNKKGGNAGMADTNLKLKSWEDFSAGMEKHMTEFDEILREHILIALYHRAEQRRWLEELRSKVSSQTASEIPSIRK